MPASRRVLAATLLLAAACGGPDTECSTSAPPTPLDHATTGRITGTVSFQGTAPPPSPLQLSGECAARHAGPVTAGDVLVVDGHVQNAFVYIKEGLAGQIFAVPSEPVIIDQQACTYVPRILGARACQPIEFVNSDPLLHNVHGIPGASPPWNFSMGVQGSRRTLRVPRPEVMVDVRCDVHPWMRAFVGILDHPYYTITGAEGRFSLSDVPPGDYVVASWHERFGVREARVRLAPSGTAEASFTYAAGTGN